jgi:ankyrin repeat protein
MMAAREGHMDVVQMLIAAGADPSLCAVISSVRGDEDCVSVFRHTLLIVS